jgi:alpha-galactosidase
MITVTEEERRLAQHWAAEHLASEGDLPFSFTYGGAPSASLLKGWRRTEARRPLDAGRNERILTFADPQTGLVVRCVAVEYTDFPAVEWTVYLRNDGAVDTPLLADLHALDVQVTRAEGDEFVLHYQRGDFCTADSYQPFALQLWHNMALSLAPVGGRGTNSAFPYFNVQKPDGGVIGAIGWPGQWRAAFHRDDGRGLRLLAGQETVRLRLRPGEEIRTPLIVLLFWAGDDVVRSQNLWRRWMLAHNTPRPGGQALGPLYAFCSGGFFPGLKVSAASERLFLDVLAREGIDLDYWWMDAGWYPCDAWPQVGTWEPDPSRFPQGIREISDLVHARGSRLIVWFEPERVAPGTWLYTNHPEWLLGQDEGMKLLDLGNAAARMWAVDHISRLIREHGIDLYRQDFNIDPLPFWRAHDAPDRQGMTENRYIQGYLAFWDELRRRHPGMLIDSCASGGRRNDLETLRRAVPLLRSDYQSFEGDPVTAPGNQCHTYALASWLPYTGHGVYYNPQHDPRAVIYLTRSSLCPAFVIAVDVRRPDVDWDLYRCLVDQWRQVADCYLGDYYPLTPYTLADDQWLAWQFDRPDLGRGMVQAFRRAACPDESGCVVLRGLVAEARYVVVDLDSGTESERSGSALMNEGINVRLPHPASAALLSYRMAASRNGQADEDAV